MYKKINQEKRSGLNYVMYDLSNNRKNINSKLIVINGTGSNKTVKFASELHVF